MCDELGTYLLARGRDEFVDHVGCELKIVPGWSVTRPRRHRDRARAGARARARAPVRLLVLLLLLLLLLCLGSHSN